MQLTRAKKIRRKTTVPDTDRTHGKDEAADYIQTEIVEKDRWPMNLTDIAAESDWSRQHIANTLSDYFEDASEPNRNQTSSSSDKTVVEGIAGRIEIEVPENVDEETYLRGWVAGYVHAKK